MKPQTLFVALAACLAACGQSPFAPQTPSSSDLARELPKVIVGAALLNASLYGCAEGQQNGQDVEACNVCFVTVAQHGTSQAFSGGQTGLSVTQYRANIAFSQAISEEQPNIQPKAGSPGVWVIHPESVRISPDQWSAVVPSDLAVRTGYQPATGFSAWNQMMYGNELPASVRQTISNDPALAAQLTNLLPACSENSPTPPTPSHAALSAPASSAPPQNAAPSPPTQADLDAAAIEACAVQHGVYIPSTRACPSSIPDPMPDHYHYATGVQWSARPDASDFASLYPANVGNAGSRVRLRCVIKDDGTLACTVEMVAPVENAGAFGDASLRLSHFFRAQPKLADGSSAAGRLYRLNITWQRPD